MTTGKLGVQTQRLDRRVLDFCLRAEVGVFKSIAPQPVDLLRELKAALPGCVFIYRPYFNTQPLNNPKRRAREVYDAAMPHLAAFPYDYTEGYNETGLWDDGPLYNKFTVELAGLLHQTGQKLLAYSFSVGNPSGPSKEELPYERDPALWMQKVEEQWAIYHDGLRAADGLALHQYKLPSHDDKFTLLRHRLVQHVLPPDLRAKPIFLTEFGLDDSANPGQSGWRGSSWNWSAEQYAQWLLETYRRIRNEVAGAAVFVCGGMGWESFEVVGQPPIADAIRQANEEVETVIPHWIEDIRDQVNYDTGRTRDTIRGICVHHAGSRAPLDNLIAYFKRGESVASYHVLIGAGGRIIYLNDISRVVWHAGDGSNGPWNTGGVAICFEGDLRGQGKPTNAQFAAFRKLRAWLVTQGVGTEIVCHKMVRVPPYSTECPGDWWPDGVEAHEIGALWGDYPLEDELAKLREHNAKLQGQVRYAELMAEKIRDYMREG